MLFMSSLSLSLTCSYIWLSSFFVWQSAALSATPLGLYFAAPLGRSLPPALVSKRLLSRCSASIISYLKHPLGIVGREYLQGLYHRLRERSEPPLDYTVAGIRMHYHYNATCEDNQYFLPKVEDPLGKAVAQIQRAQKQACQFLVQAYLHTYNGTEHPHPYDPYLAHAYQHLEHGYSFTLVVSAFLYVLVPVLRMTHLRSIFLPLI
uniref:Minor glycoprotein n=1 Tax=Kibale red colobus virus 1 TaxID=1885929 RepID=X2D684_9NIDO|nr:minor glycoprotein [Kibale red colobus virus 1]